MVKIKSSLFSNILFHIKVRHITEVNLAVMVFHVNFEVATVPSKAICLW